MSRPSLWAIYGQVRKSPGAPSGVLGTLAILVVALYLWSFGWNRAVADAQRRNDTVDNIRHRMMAARRRSGPVVYRLPLCMPCGDAELRCWLEDALGAPAPDDLLENLGACWSQRHVFGSLYRLPEPVFIALDGGVLEVDSTPFGGATDGCFAVGSFGCTDLHTELTPRNVHAALPHITLEDRAWVAVCGLDASFPGTGSPHATWDTPTGNAMPELWRGDFVVLHDPSIRTTPRPGTWDFVLAAFIDLEQARVYARDFTARTGVGSCVAHRLTSFARRRSC